MKLEVSDYKKLCISLIFFFIMPLLTAPNNVKSEHSSEVSGIRIPEPKVEYPIDFKDEKLCYQFGWRKARSVVGELEVKEPEPGIYHIVARGRTVGFARKLWKAEDWVESFCNKSDFKPLRYMVHINEPFSKYQFRVEFDRKLNIATGYWEYPDPKKNSTKKTEFRYGFDPASLGYLIRTQKWEIGQVKQFEFVDGRDRWLLLLKPIAKEEIETKFGKVPAIKIMPWMVKLPRKLNKETKELEEEIKKSKPTPTPVAKDVYFWVSEGGKHEFLKMKAKSFIGYVEMNIEPCGN